MGAKQIQIDPRDPVENPISGDRWSGARRVLQQGRLKVAELAAGSALRVLGGLGDGLDRVSRKLRAYGGDE